MKNNSHVSCFCNLECFCMDIFRTYKLDPMEMSFISWCQLVWTYCFVVQSQVPTYLTIFFFSSTATGRVSDGAAVSVSRVGFSSGSARLQTIVFETDPAGGEVAGGMRGRGRADDHPLPVSMRPAWPGSPVPISSLASTCSMLQYLTHLT